MPISKLEFLNAVRNERYNTKTLESLHGEMTVTDLCNITGYQHRTMIKVLNRLFYHGYITRYKTLGKNKRQTWLYSKTDKVYSPMTEKDLAMRLGYDLKETDTLEIEPQVIPERVTKNGNVRVIRLLDNPLKPAPQSKKRSKISIGSSFSII